MSECSLEFLSGSVVAKLGDRFTDKRKEWEIVGFETRYDEMTILCKPVDGILPGYWRNWERPDHSVAWCGDSVAAILLTKVDGIPRSARGHVLTHGE